MTTTPIKSINDELLAEIERDFSALTCSIEFGEETTRKAAGVCLMATELRRLRAENEAQRVDAGRYRWLREQEAERGISVVHITGWERAATCWATTYPDAELLDTAIDTAMQSNTEGK